jgi:anti-sigma B factor antagonist
MPKENIQIVRSTGPRNGTVILQVKGSLNIHTVFDFQTAVRAETAPALIVDFRDVPFIDSAGLGALVGAYVAAQKSNRKLAFAGMNEQVKALMEMTRVSQLFPTFPTVQDAEAAIS